MCIVLVLSQVLGFASFVAVTATVHEQRNWFCRGDSCNFINSPRFLLLVVLTFMIYEIAVTVVRFINFNVINAFSKILLVVSDVLSEVL